jgi:hypothetical protein
VTVFGDDEPEDAWDANDSPAEQLGNLIKRVKVLHKSVEHFLDGRDRLRFDQLSDDLLFLKERLSDG